jgi:hypothetical protein
VEHQVVVEGWEKRPPQSDPVLDELKSKELLKTACSVIPPPPISKHKSRSFLSQTTIRWGFRQNLTRFQETPSTSSANPPTLENEAFHRRNRGFENLGDFLARHVLETPPDHRHPLRLG